MVLAAGQPILFTYDGQMAGASRTNTLLHQSD
jgi:hypothetical protein